MNSPRMRYRSKSEHVWWVSGSVVAAVFWGVLLAFTPELDARRAGSRLWMIGSAAFLVSVGWAQAGVLASGLRVLGGSTLPRRLWAQWARATLATTSGACALVAAGNLTLLLTLTGVESGVWVIAIGLPSLAVSVGVVAGLSRRCVVHPAGSWLILLATIAMFVGSERVGGNHASGLDANGPWPVVWHLSWAFVWPATAFALGRWLPRAQMRIASVRQAPRGIFSSLRSLALRYTPITNFTFVSDGLLPTPKWWTPLFSAAMPLIGLPPMVRDHWRAEAGPQHLLWLGFIVIYLINALVWRDAHWRRLLAPGGPQLNRLGWHILRSTLELMVPVLGVVLGLGALSVAMLHMMNLQQMLSALLEYRALPVEFSFLICWSIAVASVQRRWLMYLLAWSPPSIGATAYVSIWGWSLSEPKWFEIGPAYLATLTAASFALMFVANRRWTIQRLMQRMRPGLVRRRTLLTLR